MKSYSTKRLVGASLAAALIFIATYLIKVEIGSAGYIHVGDGVILAFSALLGPVSIFASALGSALSDLISGYPLYIIPTAIIKGLVAAIVCFIPFSKYKFGLIFKFSLAELLMVVLYFLVDFMYHGFAVAMQAMPLNLLQGLSGVVIGYILLSALKKVNLKKYL